VIQAGGGTVAAISAEHVFKKLLRRAESWELIRIPGFFSETTPRTCPSNPALFVHRQFSYSQRNNGYI
jgi:hypothetical protein